MRSWSSTGDENTCANKIRRRPDSRLRTSSGSPGLVGGMCRRRLAHSASAIDGVPGNRPTGREQAVSYCGKGLPFVSSRPCHVPTPSPIHLLLLPLIDTVLCKVRETRANSFVKSMNHNNYLLTFLQALTKNIRIQIRNINSFPIVYCRSRFIVNASKYDIVHKVRISNK